MNVFGLLKEAGWLFKETAIKWYERDPFRSSTVIAYYTIFSLPGLLVIIINTAGYFFGQEQVSQKVISQIDKSIGSNAAQAVTTIIHNAGQGESLTISSIVGLATLLFGATGVFFQLQKSLNMVWGVEPQPKRKWLKFIIDRLFSFGIILTVGFLLLVSLLLSTVLSAISAWISLRFTLPLNALFYLLDLSVSLAAITFLFAAIFKILPDAEVGWRDVWVGALVTSLLFVIAKFSLSYYFGQSQPAWAYGAAGSIVLIMLWVSYSSMLLLFGAEFTRVYAMRRGHYVPATEIAEAVQHKRMA